MSPSSPLSTPPTSQSGCGLGSGQSSYAGSAHRPTPGRSPQSQTRRRSVKLSLRPPPPMGITATANVRAFTAGEAITTGQVVTLDSTGRVVLCNGSGDAILG